MLEYCASECSNTMLQNARIPEVLNRNAQSMQRSPKNTLVLESASAAKSGTDKLISSRVVTIHQSTRDHDD